MRTRPIIGVTLDSEPAGGWSRYPWYALRANYAEAVAGAGGLPLALPHCPRWPRTCWTPSTRWWSPGGAFDVDPALYGETARIRASRSSGRARAAELALLRGALARDMPVLGICGGEQLLAVALGGTLIQHIPDAVPDALAHEQPNPRHEPGHERARAPGTLLRAHRRHASACG